MANDPIRFFTQAPIIPTSGEVAYTPTFTSFGTVSNINVTYQLISANQVLIRASFTTGASPVTSQARMSLPAGMITPATGPSIQYLGSMAQKLGGSATDSVLAAPSVGYVLFAHDNGSTQNALTPLNGDDFFGSTDTSFSVIVPIQV